MVTPMLVSALLLMLISLQRFDFVVGQTTTKKIGDWNQIRADIDGAAAYDQSGYSVAMSADGTTIAVGAIENDGSGGGGGRNSGQVRAYKLDAATDRYTPFAQNINGKAAGDLFGHSVALSADGNTMAVGAIKHDGNGLNAGLVQLFKVDAQSSVVQYKQMGSDILGEAIGDEFGFSLAMSADGTTFIVGAPDNGGNGVDAGQARVYKVDASSSTKGYTQIGADLNGNAARDNFGVAVAISADGTTVAIGAPYNDDGGLNAGSVRVYKLNSCSSQYNQIGVDILGETPDDLFGYSLAMSADGTTIAVGAIRNDGSGAVDAGHVRVLKINSQGQYIPIRFDIDGEGTADEAGTSVAMSADGTIIAVGAPYATSAATGHVRVYKLDVAAGQYKQMGTDIDGEASNNFFGWSLDMSNDGTMLVVGAIYNDGTNGVSSGQVRVYRYLPTTTTTIPGTTCGLFCSIWRFICGLFGFCSR